MDIFFGWGLKFGAGSSPAVAMNTEQDIVMAHVPSGHELTYRQGSVQHASVAWRPDQRYGDGREPAIAMSRTHVLGVHRGVSDERLFYELATFSNGIISWIGDDKYDDGLTPAVAINDLGVVLEVHKASKDRLWYNAGLIDDTSIDWNRKDDFADGATPSVALNNRGEGVVAYSRDNVVYIRLVKTDGKNIDINAEYRAADYGTNPSVAITDQGWIVICFSRSDKLVQLLASTDGNSVGWGNEIEFDTGVDVAVAAQAGLAVQVHRSEQDGSEFFSTSLITNRSSWMYDRPVQLAGLPLRELILPGSHDAGMYPSTVTNFAQTQDKTIYQQLTYGARWFDLRIAYWPSLGDYYAYHGSEPFPGGKFTDMLDDVKRFKEHKGPGELIILKLSHFESSFGLDDWKWMVKEIDDRIGQWLYRGPLPSGKRLADVTLSDYNGAVLVVVDKNWAKDHPHPGLWVYRDSTSDDAAAGDLRVYDKYSNTDNYSKMRDEQIQHFFEYDGLCVDKKTPCDLFLLSWTLTPQTIETVIGLAHIPNQHLGDEVAKLPITNSFGKIINIAYVDFLQYARTSDVAIMEKYIGTSG